MLVKAGSAVDDFIAQILPFVEKGDIIIDGGNSEYLDTQVQLRGVASFQNSICISLIALFKSKLLVFDNLFSISRNSFR